MFLLHSLSNNTHIFDQSIALLSQEDNLDVGRESKMPV